MISQIDIGEKHILSVYDDEVLEVSYDPIGKTPSGWQNRPDSSGYWWARTKWTKYENHWSVVKVVCGNVLDIEMPGSDSPFYLEQFEPMWLRIEEPVFPNERSEL